MLWKEANLGSKCWLGFLLTVIFIYLPVLTLPCCVQAFSSYDEEGLLSGWQCGGFSLGWLLLFQSTGSRVQAPVVGTWAWLPCSVWNLSRPSWTCPLHWQWASRSPTVLFIRRWFNFPIGVTLSPMYECYFSYSLGWEKCRVTHIPNTEVFLLLFP